MNKKPYAPLDMDNWGEKPKYFVRMERVPGLLFWQFFIVPRNGKAISQSTVYKNKAQCRNVGKKFADAVGLEWRESE